MRDGWVAIPEFEVSLDTKDDEVGGWVMASADAPGEVRLSLSEYETVTLAMTPEQAREAATALLAAANWTEQQPFMAMHGPLYPPPGYVVLNGQMMEARGLTVPDWIEQMQPEIPFLSRISVGDYARETTAPWGMAPKKESDDANGT